MALVVHDAIQKARRYDTTLTVKRDGEIVVESPDQFERNMKKSRE